MLTYVKHLIAQSDSGHLGGAVDGRRLWTGGLVTALIVGGLAIVEFLLFSDILHYPLLGNRGSGAVAHTSMIGYAAGAALAALLATAAMHALLLTAPRPRWFFGWLGGIGTAIAVLLPLAQDLPAPLATATVNLVLGLATIGLVQSTTAASLRSRSVAHNGAIPRQPLRRRMIPHRRQGHIALP
jgi:hypothetical protein